VSEWRYIYSGRGYLRFRELAITIECGTGECTARVYRRGPSRVAVSLEGQDEILQAELDEIAERIRGQVVVFCQAAILDFGLGEIETVDDEGEPHRSVYARVLAGKTPDATVCVPFEHQTDMSATDVETLETIVANAKPIRPALVDSIEHSLTGSEGAVESFLANYAVLESLLGSKQDGVDGFIQRVEPEVEMTKDTRGKDVTIYTRLRNAKGHPSGMPPAEASARIRKLLPRLRAHVRTALLESMQC
jgi:hypothetical protein